MRTRINKYTIIGERQIKLETPITIEDVRLIINETKKIVIASSMQKDNITIEGGIITYTDALPISEVGDYFTIEIDKGETIKDILGDANVLLSDVSDGKAKIANAINTKGGSASADSSFSQLAEDIESIEITNLDLNSFTFDKEVHIDSLLDFLAYRNSIVKIESNKNITLNHDYALANLSNVERISLNGNVEITGEFTFSNNPTLKVLSVDNINEKIFSNIITNSNNIEELNLKVKDIRYNTERTVLISNKKKLRKLDLALETTSAGIIKGEVDFEILRLPNFHTTVLGNLGGNYDLVVSDSLKVVEFPNLNQLHRYDWFNAVAGGLKLERVQVGRLASINVNGANLIDLEVGEINTNMSIYRWKPTNVLLDPEKIETLNYNIREHIAKKIADRSNKSPLTITFSQGAEAVRNVLTEETEAVFASKNWNISPAKSV